MSTRVPLWVEAGQLKMLRETLCRIQTVALGYLADEFGSTSKLEQDRTRLQLLIDEIDQHRPLGSNGKHGNLHTETCGCDEPDWGPGAKSDFGETG